MKTTVKKEVLKTKVKTKVKKDNTLILLNKILDDYFIKDCIDNIDDTMIICPVGTFMKEDDVWGFDLNFSFMTEHNDSIMLMNLITDIAKKGIDLIFFMGYHTVFNDDDICCGLVFEQDIQEYIDDNDCDYEDALDVLSETLILDYEKETSGKTSEKNKPKGNLQ